MSNKAISALNIYKALAEDYLRELIDEYLEITSPEKKHKIDISIKAIVKPV